MAAHLQTQLNSHIRHFLFLIFCLCFINKVFAQDVLVLKDGSELNVKVLEIGEHTIKYQELANPGPDRTVYKSQVFMIKYANGAKEIFDNALPPPSPKPATVMAHPRAGAVDTLSFKNRAPTFSGPRVGMTYITPGLFAEELADRGKSPYLTQFGWQFEQRIFTINNGPTGLVEFVLFAGGMEQGIFLPSGTLLFGLRGSGDQSLEFGLGPNLSIGGVGMVLAAGMNFHTESINFPVNLAFVPSTGRKEYDNTTQKEIVRQTGHRLTLTVGFNRRTK
jgi:hypothetical protein